MDAMRYLNLPDRGDALDVLTRLPFRVQLNVGSGLSIAFGFGSLIPSNHD